MSESIDKQVHEKLGRIFGGAYFDGVPRYSTDMAEVMCVVEQSEANWGMMKRAFGWEVVCCDVESNPNPDVLEPVMSDSLPFAICLAYLNYLELEASDEKD